MRGGVVMGGGTGMGGGIGMGGGVGGDGVLSSLCPFLFVLFGLLSFSLSLLLSFPFFFSRLLPSHILLSPFFCSQVFSSLFLFPLSPSLSFFVLS